MLAGTPQMTRRTAIASLAAMAGAAPATAGVSPPPLSTKTPAFRPFELAALKRALNESGRSYLPFLDEPTMSTGLYGLAAGAVDEQQPHELDEAYVVMEGKARFTAAGETRAVGPGDILFVRAKAEHRFHDIEEDLILIVFFSKASG